MYSSSTSSLKSSTLNSRGSSISSVNRSRNNRRGFPSASSVSSANKSRNNRKGLPVSCNRCKQPIDSTVFICSCRCLFCEDCAYSHFNSNPNCPSCGRLLGENDFTDLVISDKSSKLATNPDEIMQSLLTKTSLQPGAPMTFSDMAARVLHEQDALLENKKLFVNQFLRETQRRFRGANKLKNELDIYKKQIGALRKDVDGLKRQHEEDVERIREKDRQIQQLKSMLNSKTPQHGVKRRRSESRPVPTMVGVPNTSTPVSTMCFNQKKDGFQNYVRKKENGELIQEQNLMNPALKRKAILHR